MLHVHRIKMNFKAYKFNKVKKNSTEGSSNSLLLMTNFKVKDKYSRFKFGSEIILTDPLRSTEVLVCKLM